MVNRISVAFQGEPGAYSEAAALEYFHSEVETLPCHSFEEVFNAVSTGRSDYGFLPIENSLAGSIHQNYDLLLRIELQIAGEHHYHVRHCLLALPGVKIAEVRKVYSHPQALAQCEANIKRLGLVQVPEYDTAGSARLIHEMGDHQVAALASRRAAEVYGLEVLAEDMQDYSANYTRFLSLAREPARKGSSENEVFKTSVVFSLHNQPGALFKALSVFALRDIDLTKIESRPIPGKPWEYMFYIDFAGHAGDLPCSRALEHLKELAPFLRVLGSYPRHQMSHQEG
jgi:prephenate dehydratase